MLLFERHSQMPKEELASVDSDFSMTNEKESGYHSGIR
jgi:hypothetical protein